MTDNINHSYMHSGSTIFKFSYKSSHLNSNQITMALLILPLICHLLFIIPSLRNTEVRDFLSCLFSFYLSVSCRLIYNLKITVRENWSPWVWKNKVYLFFFFFKPICLNMNAGKGIPNPNARNTHSYLSNTFFLTHQA